MEDDDMQVAALLILKRADASENKQHINHQRNGYSR